MGGMELYPLEQPQPTFYGGGVSRSRIDHVTVSAGGREWWMAGVSSLVYGREKGHRVVTHRSDADRLSKFLGMGDWGRRWRKASGRARAQREAERRALPSVLEAHEVEAFRAQWDRAAMPVEPASQAVEELEAIAVWGQELWRERGLQTPIKGAPKEVSGRGWRPRTCSANAKP